MKERSIRKSELLTELTSAPDDKSIGIE